MRKRRFVRHNHAIFDPDEIIYATINSAEKPVDLLKRFVKVSSKENDVVLDPFMGSGSTGVACVNTNRRFVGIEIDDKYFNVAKDRIIAARKVG